MGNASPNSSGFEVTAVGNPTINNQLPVFDKVGLLVCDFQVNVSSLGSNGTTDTDVFFGVGCQYEISGNLAVRASWDHYTVEDSDIDFLSASAVFSF